VKTIDRYLLARYFYVFAVFFTAAMGLFIIADGFTNLDDFQHRAGDGGTRALLAMMGQHYLYQSSRIFSLAGPTLAVMSAMCVLALTLKHGEINPLLAAGVPLYRVAMPLVIGVIAINGLLAINEELIIPRIATHLQTKHGDSGSDAQGFEPTYDFTTLIWIQGSELFPTTGTIKGAKFVLPKNLVAEKTFVSADEAVYQPERRGRPAGWLLKNATPRFGELQILPQGAQVVQAQPNPDELFIRSSMTFDQLYNRSTGFRYLSTLDLVWRIRNPSAGEATRRAQVLHFHERLTRPLLTIVGLFLVIPLVARREKLSLVSNVAMCMTAVGCVYAGSQALLLVGQTGWISPAACAWLPLIGGGSLGAWLSPIART
jgi:lipopolysaccharide export system permease protein